MLPFGKWRPDIYDLNTQFAGEASGVLPGATSKRPWPQLSIYTNALAAVCRGATIAISSTGAYSLFAGTATRLYKFNSSTLNWDNVTRTVGGDYALGTDDRWQFAQFGFYLYATNIADTLQRFDIDSGTNFAAVSGSPPQARYIRTIGDQIFLGSLASLPNRVHWSGRNNPVFWTAGGGQDCDYQDFPDGGFVRGMTGIRGGYIFQDTAVRQFQPSQGREIYQFQQIEGAQGLVAPDSLVTHMGMSYYVGLDGFVAIGPQGSQSIGQDAVDDWFLSNVDIDRVALTIGARDPGRPRIFWLFPTSTSGYVLDHVICYDITLDEWTHAPLQASVIFQAATAGTGLDSLDTNYPDVDAMTVSLDSRIFAGGAPLIAAFDGNHKMSFFTGSNMAATVETAEFQAIPFRRGYVRGIAPLTDASAVTIQVSKRENLNATATWGSASSLNNQGVAPARSSGRYHRVRASIAAGAPWNDLRGVEIDAVDAGAR